MRKVRARSLCSHSVRRSSTASAKRLRTHSFSKNSSRDSGEAIFAGSMAVAPSSSSAAAKSRATCGIRPPPALVPIEFVEQLAFEKFRKKSLREILGRLGRALPPPAHIFIDGLPVSRAQRLECLLALLGIDAARRLDHGTPR